MLTWQEALTELKTQWLSYFPSLITGLVIFIVFWCIAWVVRMIIHRVERNASASRRPILSLLGYANRVVILGIGLITALGSMGVNVSALVASLGITGVAISFAMQDALANLFAGFVLLLYQPFDRGDRIRVKGYEGRVVRITLRYICLEADECRFLIPNSVMMKESVTVFDAEAESPEA